MKNMTLLLFTVFFVFPFTAGGLMQVSVSVNSDVDGYVSFSEIPDVVNRTYQDLTIVWENTGSVGCRVRGRADIYGEVKNKTTCMYSAWSREEYSEPGTLHNLRLHWYPDSGGNYSVKTRIYYCNTIVEGPGANFTVIREGESNESNTSNETKTMETPDLLDISVSTNKSMVEFSITPKEDIDKVLITPTSYPTAWIFESEEIDHLRKGEVARVEIGYEPGIWKRRNISFTLVSMDGSLFIEKTVELEPGKDKLPLEHVVIAALIVVMLILSIMLSKARKWI